MEDETLGLGFDHHRIGITGAAPTAFVAAAIRDFKDENNNHSANGNNHSAEAHINNGAICGTIQNANGIPVMQQQYNLSQSQVQQSAIPPPQTTNHPQQPYYNPMSQLQQSQTNPAIGAPTSYPPPSSSTSIPTMPLHAFPPPPPHPTMPMQPLPIQTQNPNPIPSQQPPSALPSFEPPPGLPPTFAPAPTFPPPPQPNNHTALPSPVVPIPPPAAMPLPPHPTSSTAVQPAPLPHSQPQQEQRQQQQITQPLQPQSTQNNDSIGKARAIAMRFQQEKQQTQQPSQHDNELNQQQGQQEQQPQNDDPIERARAIALKFQQEAIQDPTIPTSIPYAAQRTTHFQAEKRKFQSFHLKNLEYVMAHEEKALRHQVACMNQMTAYEEKQLLAVELQKEQRRQHLLEKEDKKRQREQMGMLNEGSGGIGTKEQRRAERVRKRQHNVEHDASSTANGPSDASKKLRTSLYLTNLPTDGSTTERTLQSLFCSYGRLDRVTMYRHRSNGELKGDGLVVFGRDAVEEYWRKNNTNGGSEEDGDGDVDLVEAVCAQMNGAELPCGTAIGVQPADMDYKKKKKSKNDEAYAPQKDYAGGNTREAKELTQGKPLDNGTTTMTSTSSAGKVEATTISGGSDDKNANDDDDLDDFFASLE